MTFQIDDKSITLPPTAPGDIPTPAAGEVTQFFGLDGRLYAKDSTGAVYPASNGGGGGGGDVSTVNGVSPDGSGNVVIGTSQILYAPGVTATQAINNAQSAGETANTNALNAQTDATAALSSASTANTTANIALEVADNAMPIASLTPAFTRDQLQSLSGVNRLDVSSVKSAVGIALSANLGSEILVNENGVIVSPGNQGFLINCFLTVIGQSNEQGATFYTDANGVNQRYFVNAPSQGLFEPLPSVRGAGGSMMTRLCENLAKDSIRTQFFNGAIGGASLITTFVGVATGWQSNFAYMGARASLGAGDPGTKGSVVRRNNGEWECTTGNVRLAFLDPTDTPVVVGSTSYYYSPAEIVAATNLTSGATEPTWPTATVGATVSDGGLVWTCRRVGVTALTGAARAVLGSNNPLFDPYNAIQRVVNAGLKTQAATQSRFCIIQNGQSDMAATEAEYSTAIAQICSKLASARIIPIIQLSLAGTGAGQSQAGWTRLETAISGTDRDVAPAYATSPTTQATTPLGLTLQVPGAARATNPFYYGTSLYRQFGIDDAFLQADKLHTNKEHIQVCADAMSPLISRIIRNVAS